MRAKVLLVGAVALLLGSCTTRVVHAPPAPNKQLLPGKWKNSADLQFVTGYEFADDGTVKVGIQGMEQPLAGRYTWSSERTLDLEYPATPEVQKAYQTAAKAYKEQVEARVKKGDLYERAAPALLGSVRDELPAKETIKVALSEAPLPSLYLEMADGATQTFEKKE
jgi:hypothetical protein